MLVASGNCCGVEGWATEYALSSLIIMPELATSTITNLATTGSKETWIVSLPLMAGAELPDLES